jgi:hypothetical protein
MRVIPVSSSATTIRTRLRWQRMAAQIAQRARASQGAVSPWLDDHAYRKHKGVKGADQLARLMEEASAAGLSADEQDALLLDYVRGVRRDIARRPAA